MKVRERLEKESVRKLEEVPGTSQLLPFNLEK